VAEPDWIDLPEVVALHDQLLALFGGPEGLRDAALLEAALARPRQHFAPGVEDRVDLAAHCTEALIRNHPFVDGNKRTAFLVGVLFLELNGYVFEAPEAEAARAVLGLAAAELDRDAYRAFLARHSRGGEA
jgi:death-on-curing protein